MSAAVSTSSPRETLTSTAPAGSRASARASMIPSVCAVSGRCSESTSDAASNSSTPTIASTPTDGVCRAGSCAITLPTSGLAIRAIAMGVAIIVTGSSARLVDALRAAEHIEFAAMTIGRFDALCTLSASSLGVLQATVDQLRGRDDVSALTSWAHMRILRENYRVIR
ncbi:MAG: hypothetical protein QM622_06160 [Microbacterium sp.]